MITRTAFTTGLDRILLVAAIIAFVAGVVSLAASRSKDFAHVVVLAIPETAPGRPGVLASLATGWSHAHGGKPLNLVP